MSSLPKPVTGRTLSTRSFAGRIVLWFFSIAIALAGLGFAYKLHEFIDDLSAQEGLNFAGAHVVVYVLVASGCLCLLGGAFLKGHFADIEKPKFDLLETEVAHDRAEFDRGA